MKSVYVVGKDFAVKKMFLGEGWALSGPESHVPDLICFTGGEDVSPELYGEKNTSSWVNKARDDFEKEVYERYVGKAPMVGICRGGQFLNVMNGGKMIQHINGHMMGVRECTLLIWEGSSPGPHHVHEDHHQGIVPTSEAEVIGFDPRDNNIEIVWYEETKCLCFQPHPEWGHEPTKDLFFNLIKEYIG